MENKQLNETQLQALLRLKRHEQPPPGYFDDLLSAIHRRQREEMLRRPAWRLFFERIAAFFSSLRREWAYGASMLGILMIGIGTIQIAMPKRPAAPVQAASAPAPAPDAALAKMQPVKAKRPQTGVPANAPTRFVIEPQPASYEQPRIRF